MKKIILVRLDKACDPEVESLKDVIELVKKVSASEEACECECKKKKAEPKEEKLSECALDLISTIAKDLGLDASALKADILAQKLAAEEKAKEEERKIKTPKVDFDKQLNDAYHAGTKDGYEKGFGEAISFMKSRLIKLVEDLSDMEKWNFKDGTLKEDVIFTK